jgi:Carboxypeptidase regulatory-like domain
MSAQAMWTHAGSWKMRILTNVLLVFCLLRVCEASQEVVQYSRTRSVSSLSGMVVDTTGAAIPNAQVCSMSAGWRTELKCTTTDCDGHWSLSVTPKKKLYYLRFVKATFNQVWIKARLTRRKAPPLTVEMPVAT